MNLKDEILELERNCLERLGHGLDGERARNDRYSAEYYRSYHENLYEEMDAQHKKEYGGGSGGEMKDKQYPAKMSSIRSSSAMTFNLLGNHSVTVKQNPYGFSEGIYHVAYEKKMPSLYGRNPANLDAYLRLEGKEGKTEAVFCEMKMMEWILNTPGYLNEAYKKKENYFAGQAADVFLKAISMLEQSMTSHKVTVEESVGNEIQKNLKEVFSFPHYDAWQMFKHTLGIYNMTSKYTAGAMKEEYGSSADVDIHEMRDKFYKVTLLNVVFEPPVEAVREEKNRERLLEYKDSEHEDFELKFRRIIRECGVQQLFLEDCGFEFDVMYLPVKDFMTILDMSEERWKYLDRYRLEG